MFYDVENMTSLIRKNKKKMKQTTFNNQHVFRLIFFLLFIQKSSQI